MCNTDQRSNIFHRDSLTVGTFSNSRKSLNDCYALSLFASKSFEFISSFPFLASRFTKIKKKQQKA